MMTIVLLMNLGFGAGTVFAPLGYETRVVGRNTYQAVAAGRNVYQGVAAGRNAYQGAAAGTDTRPSLPAGLGDVR